MKNFGEMPMNAKESDGETEVQEELEFIIEKITFIDLPQDLQSEIKEGLKSFVETGGESVIDELNEISQEIDMLMNYKTELQKAFRDAESNDEIETIMKKAGAALATIKRIINRENNNTIQ